MIIPRCLTPGAVQYHMLQYFTLRFPDKWELTWGGLRRKPKEDRKAKKMKALYEKVRAVAKELGLDPNTFERIVPARDRSVARYDDANEEVN